MTETITKNIILIQSYGTLSNYCEAKNGRWNQALKMMLLLFGAGPIRRSTPKALQSLSSYGVQRRLQIKPDRYETLLQNLCEHGFASRWRYSWCRREWRGALAGKAQIWPCRSDRVPFCCGNRYLPGRSQPLRPFPAVEWWPVKSAGFQGGVDGSRGCRAMHWKSACSGHFWTAHIRRYNTGGAAWQGPAAGCLPSAGVWTKG